MEEGKCIIVSAPSGAGKTTIVHHLLQQFPELAFSISACSRAKRPDEIDGKDYHFLSVEDFRLNMEKDVFVEWEEVYPGQFYGTMRSEIHRIWAQEKVVIFDVDVEGGIRLKQIFGEQALAIFIMPPSIKDLETRLVERASDPIDKIKLRLSKAENELKRAGEFDQIVMNDELTHAKQDAEQLVRDFLKTD